MFSRKMMFKRAEQLEVAWSKVGAIRRILEDFPQLLLHNNARPHTANKTNETLRNFKWDGMVWIALIWLRIGTNGGLFWAR
jgi:hypothetical protein